MIIRRLAYLILLVLWFATAATIIIPMIIYVFFGYDYADVLFLMDKIKDE